MNYQFPRIRLTVNISDMKRAWIMGTLILAFAVSAFGLHLIHKQNNLLHERQQLSASILIFSLEYKEEYSKFSQLIKSLDDFRDFNDEIALVRANSDLERAKIHLHTINEQAEIANKLIKTTQPLLNSLSKTRDSLSQVLSNKPENSQAFLLFRKLLPFAGEETDAFEFVQSEALKLIKTPKTAKPASFTDEQTVVAKFGNRYFVSSWFDAQNSYGTMIRETYAGLAEKKGEKWMLIGCSLIPQNNDLN